MLCALWALLQALFDCGVSGKTRLRLILVIAVVVVGLVWPVWEVRENLQKTMDAMLSPDPDPVDGRTFVKKIPTNTASDSIDEVNMDEIDVAYIKAKSKHVEIKEAADRYEAKCRSKRHKHLEETKHFSLELDRIEEKLAAKNEAGDNVYSKEHRKELGRKAEDLVAKIKERLRYESCMAQQMGKLENVSGVEVIQSHAVSVKFNWKDMMIQEGLCDDPNKCFCDILLKPDLRLDASLKRIEGKRIGESDMIFL